MICRSKNRLGLCTQTFSWYCFRTPPIIVILVSPHAHHLHTVLTVLCYLCSLSSHCHVAIPISCRGFFLSFTLWTQCSRCRPGSGRLEWFLGFWLFGKLEVGGLRLHVFVGRYPSHSETLASRHLIRICGARTNGPTQWCVLNKFIVAELFRKIMPFFFYRYWSTLFLKSDIFWNP